MKSKIKKACWLILGWGFIILGITGLFLPILQGILFLLIGLIILSSEYIWAHRLLTKLKRHFPGFAEKSAEASKRVAHWFSKLRGIAGPTPASDLSKVVGSSSAERGVLRSVARADVHPDQGPAAASRKTDDSARPTHGQSEAGAASAEPQFKILVALHDPDHVHSLMKVACQLAHSIGAEVAALYVEEIGPGLSLDLNLPMLDEDGRKVLSRAAEVASQQDTKISTHLIRAHQAGEAIVSQVRTEGSDLLLLGYRGKRGLKEFVLGSTFRYVIAHAPCQVIVEILPREAVISQAA